MQNAQTIDSTPSAGRSLAQHRYWSGFSVWLVVVLLAVFTWAVHRRLAQYESIQEGGHHMTATKVCLTERLRISAPAARPLEGSAFFIVAVFAFAILRLDDSSSLFRRDSVWRPRHQRISRCMTHFFFLPPPAILSAQ